MVFRSHFLCPPPKQHFAFAPTSQTQTVAPTLKNKNSAIKTIPSYVYIIKVIIAKCFSAVCYAVLIYFVVITGIMQNSRTAFALLTQTEANAPHLHKKPSQKDSKRKSLLYFFACFFAQLVPTTAAAHALGLSFL